MPDNTPMLEHWKNYLKDYISPDSFIEWGFYSLMSCALQRRVHTGPVHRPIYPNLYVVLVGPPATGKTLVVNEVRDRLREHLLIPRKATQEQQQTLADVAQGMKEASVEALASMKRMLNPPLLFPCGADSTTFEALTKELAESTRTHKTIKTMPDGTMKPDIYFHCSVAFTLSELSNLFRKKMEDVVRFLQETYDCNKMYRYTTKNKGEDIIQNVCVNILAGATPNFVRECFSSALMSEGFVSRNHFIFEKEPRFVRYSIQELSAGQKESLRLIDQRLVNLSKLYGQAVMSPECLELATYFFEKQFQAGRINVSDKLDDYYGRMRLHMDKLCMAIHFADSDDMTIQVQSMEKALDALAKVEKRMHLALTYKEVNPLSAVGKRIFTFLLKNGKTEENRLLMNFIDDLPRGKNDLIVILNDLKSMGQCERKMSLEKDSKIMWQIKDNIDPDVKDLLGMIYENVEKELKKPKSDGARIAGELEKYNV